MVQWDIGRELRRAPNGKVLYKWLSALPNAMAKQVLTTKCDAALYFSWEFIPTVLGCG